MTPVESRWMTTREAAIYAGRKSRTAWRTVNRWVRRGLVPKQYVGGDRELVVKAEGIDIALRKLREMHLRRCGIKVAA